MKLLRAGAKHPTSAKGVLTTPFFVFTHTRGLPADNAGTQDSSLRRVCLIHHPHWVFGTYSPQPRGCSTTIVASRCFVIQPALSSLQRLSRTAPTGTSA